MLCLHEHVCPDATVPNKLLPHRLLLLQIPHPPLFNALSAAAPPLVGRFNTQNLSDLAWGCASLGHKDPALFDSIANAALLLAGQCSNHSLADLCWAFATNEHARLDLFAALTPEITANLQDERFGAQWLADTLW